MSAPIWVGAGLAAVGVAAAIGVLSAQAGANGAGGVPLRAWSEPQAPAPSLSGDELERLQAVEWFGERAPMDPGPDTEEAPPERITGLYEIEGVWTAVVSAPGRPARQVRVGDELWDGWIAAEIGELSVTAEREGEERVFNAFTR